MGDQNALHDGGDADGTGDDVGEDESEGVGVEVAVDEAVADDLDVAVTVDEAETAEAEEGGGYTCGVCGETFDSPEELHKHLYRVGLVE